MRKILVMAIVALTMAACVRNVRDISEAMESGDGTAVTYMADFQLAHDITKQVLKSADTHDMIVEDDGDSFLARTRLTLIAVNLKKIDETHTQITIVTRRSVSNSIPNTLSETAFHDRFVEILKRVQK